MGLELAEFRAAVGARQEEVAEAAQVSQGTISRIESKIHRPTGTTIMRINAWADEVARRKRLPKSQWLTWDYLVNGDGAAA